MKLLIPLFFSLFCSAQSFAWMGVANDPYIIAPDLEAMKVVPYTVNYTPFIISPSLKEIELTAKVDSQEIIINDLYYHIDSITIALAKQSKVNKKLELDLSALTKSNTNEIELRKKTEGNVTLLMILGGILLATSVLFGILWMRSKKRA